MALKQSNKVAKSRNPYFKFKQFTVWQSNSAMKVCTDSCLFGALFKRLALNPGRILDIGTGTGLLALMSAQQFPDAYIDALEVADSACKDAEMNFSSSPFSKRLRLIKSSVQCFTPAEQYDLVISNPPFYENQLKTGDKDADLARHSTSLNKADLAQSIARLLHPNGLCLILIASSSEQALEHDLNKKGLRVIQRIHISNQITEAPFRTILSLAFSTGVSENLSMHLYEPTGLYSDQVYDLFKPFYTSL